ncbi:hypothetical protein L6452_32184 [Arctium lappa]|uniref:Uncharacterized protein n=1 Tax=Arctium lappa TaxID=4217 RepID=A0ACB8Z4Z8_ARCLA|nr:hypothetical protein L6452_32184 [Arctium lappa]
MDVSSLETFSDIAYQCLQNSREQRPLMAHVVEKLKIAVQYQEIYEVMELPKEYLAIIKTAVTPLIFRSEEELMRLLSKGILVNGGKTWFSRNKNGEHCELISARECLIPGGAAADEYTSEENSRFVQGNYQPLYGRFKAHARTQFLSPGIIYTVNLVFKLLPMENSTYVTPFHLKYQLGEETEPSISYLAYGRENGWMTMELYQFTSDSTRFDIDIQFQSLFHDLHIWSLLYHLDITDLKIIIEGIEFRPLEKVVHDVLEDVKVDMQPTSDLPNDYKQIIKLSKDTIKWTTKKELYNLFCKGFLISKRNGFLINNGEEWFSIANNGKKCPMLPARAILVKSEWKWKRLPSSRFKEVALDCNGEFSIICKIRSQILSPQTIYACYLVYKITENPSEFMPPMRALDKNYPFHGSLILHTLLRDSCFAGLWNIYLLTPQIRVINPKDGQNTHNPMNISEVKDLPQLRNDGWMEVQVWEFCTGIITEMISMHLALTRPPPGVIVQGIEFKPS